MDSSTVRSALISLVLPAHNEEGNVPTIYSEICGILAAMPYQIELIFVDDGSSDATAVRVRELDSSPGVVVRLIRFSRNFGHQAALLAGLHAARGAAVITMDCDLQHPPQHLPQMITAWEQGAKIVQMVRRHNAGTNWFKRTTSRSFYRVMAILSDSPVAKRAADYQLMDRQIVDYLLQIGDRQPFFRGMVSWLGFPATQIEYTAPERHAGQSSYNWRKMFNLALDGITSLSSKPLRLAFYLGLSAAGFCLIYIVFAVIAFLMGKSVPGWTSLIVTVVFLGGVQLICVGIIGEYVARIYELTRRLPPFIIAEDEKTEPPAAKARNAGE
ncbi:MAG TPA: glycosyltransferase family 2 protein [Bryobacteraceae bacterium]|nr:glycosyltransferase family 2 protein [Bryobacteraceae bacterium]